MLRSISVSGENKSFCRRELGLLKQSFDIHRVLNSERENTAIKLKNEREILTREIKQTMQAENAGSGGWWAGIVNDASPLSKSA